VLHGGSGIPRDYVMTAIKTGIAKVNVGTDIRQAFERVLLVQGRIEDAQEAVYQRTRQLVSGYFELTGTRALITCT